MLEQGDDKERMGYQLCRADLALLVPARYAHVAPLKLAGKLRRDTVIAVIPLLNFRLAIRFGNQRVIPQLYRVGFLPASRPAAQSPSFLGIGFGMACIVPAQYITRILNQRMLEPAAGAEKGDAILTRVTRRNKRRLGVLYGLAGTSQMASYPTRSSGLVSSGVASQS